MNFIGHRFRISEEGIEGFMPLMRCFFISCNIQSLLIPLSSMIPKISKIIEVLSCFCLGDALGNLLAKSRSQKRKHLINHLCLKMGFVINQSLVWFEIFRLLCCSFDYPNIKRSSQRIVPPLPPIQIIRFVSPSSSLEYIW